MNTALIGYARCSTDDQELTAQVQALDRLGVTPDRILGEFDFSDEKLQDTTDVLPAPKSRPRSSLKIGSRQITEKYPFSTRYRKSYYRFGTFMQLPPFLRCEF